MQLAPQHLRLRREGEPELDRLSPDLDNSELDIVVDDDRLAHLARQEQHFFPPWLPAHSPQNCNVSRGREQGWALCGPTLNPAALALAARPVAGCSQKLRRGGDAERP